MFRIALAAPPLTGSIDAAMEWVERHVAEAAEKKADIVCFPESYVPGLRGQGFQIEDHDPAGLEAARARVCDLAKAHAIHVILPMDWDSPKGILNAAFVISDQGIVLGCQTKNQLAPEEDDVFVPGGPREMFACKGVCFGIVICHEGWRYPETVRWAVVRGAQIVFHPTQTGNDRQGKALTTFGSPDASHFEKAMVCRSIENAIFFASVNYAMRYQETATAVIAPTGDCLSYLPYGEPGVLITDIDPAQATGLYASRLKPI